MQSVWRPWRSNAFSPKPPLASSCNALPCRSALKFCATNTTWVSGTAAAAPRRTRKQKITHLIHSLAHLAGIRVVRSNVVCYSVGENPHATRLLNATNAPSIVAAAADAPEFPVMAMTQIHKVTMGRGENQRQASVRITTIPLVPAYAITAWKAQGATYDALVLASLPLQPQPTQRHLLYVILSRVRTAAGLFTINTISPRVAGLYGPDPKLHDYFAAAHVPDDAAENLAAHIE